jgi:hypothetical protein
VDVRDALQVLVDLDVDVADLGQAREALSQSARVRSWLDAIDVSVRRRLDELAAEGAPISPDVDVARHGMTSRRDAERVARRQGALDLVPQLADPLAAGEVSGAHVDVLANGLGQLSKDDRVRLADADGDRLTRLAQRQTPDEFAKTVKEAVADAQCDGGLGTFERQRRANRLRSWTDQITGMVHLHGQFDPESGLKIVSRLRAQVESLFHTATPDGCPEDPCAKQEYLAAMALVSLVEGNTNSSGRVGIIAVIDEDSLRHRIHTQSIIDLGDPDLVLPVETLRRIACEAEIIPVVLNGDGVAVDVGRKQRLATDDQRAALRAMYPTCFGPDCTVPFDRCEIHHIDPWGNLGPTDLAKLAPGCHQHHHLLHEGGWTVSIDPTTRVATFTLPDGTTRTTRPPRAKPR